MSGPTLQLRKLSNNLPLVTKVETGLGREYNLVRCPVPDPSDSVLQPLEVFQLPSPFSVDCLDQGSCPGLPLGYWGYSAHRKCLCIHIPRQPLAKAQVWVCEGPALLWHRRWRHNILQSSLSGSKRSLGLHGKSLHPSKRYRSFGFKVSLSLFSFFLFPVPHLPFSLWFFLGALS